MASAPVGVAGEGTGGSSDDSAPHLKRGLSNRHIQMIALGGAIGVGLFLYSGKAIHTAGPSLLLCYLVGGVMVFLVMRALGELALYRPVSGSLASYAKEFIGPRAGFFTGWTYWAQWAVSGMIELTAIGIYVNKYWLPDMPQWLTGIIVLGLLYGINLMSVRFFGESEFWFSLMKILAIVGIIVIGILVLILGIGSLGKTASISNLWSHGGFFPNGYLEPLIALQFVIFAFFGVELVGVTAGEAQNPHATLPKAINRVALRIIIFYVGSLFIIMSMVAWTELGPHDSPFVVVFRQIGLPAASEIMTVVVLTAALSAGNSSMFSTGRMLFSLADNGYAPRSLARINRRGVPFRAITVSAAVMLLGVFLNYLVPQNAFAYIGAVTIMGGLMSWGMILIAHLGYRRAVRAGLIKQGKYRLPGAPWTNYVVLAFLALIGVLLGFNEQSRIALYVAPLWIGGIFGGYWLSRRCKRNRSFVMHGEPSSVPHGVAVRELEPAVASVPTD